MDDIPGVRARLSRPLCDYSTYLLIPIDSLERLFFPPKKGPPLRKTSHRATSHEICFGKCTTVTAINMGDYPYVPCPASCRGPENSGLALTLQCLSALGPLVARVRHRKHVAADDHLRAPTSYHGASTSGLRPVAAGRRGHTCLNQMRNRSTRVGSYREKRSAAPDVALGTN